MNKILLWEATLEFNIERKTTSLAPVRLFLLCYSSTSFLILYMILDQPVGDRYHVSKNKKCTFMLNDKQ